MNVSDLISHLPSQTSLARMLDARQNRSAGEYAGMLSIGLILGAALALLFAPKPGRELREQISERVAGPRKRAARLAMNGHAEPDANSRI